MPLIEANKKLIKEFYRNDANHGQLYPAVTPPPAATAARPKRGLGEGKQKPELAEGASILDERIVLYLLALPNCVTKKLLGKAYWMPHELLEHIDDLIKHFDLQLNKALWSVLQDWCLAAGQVRSAHHPTNSFVGIPIDAIIHADEDLTEWIDRRLNMTIGQKEEPATANTIPRTPARPMQRDTPSSPGFPPDTWGDIAAEVGRGIALGFQAWSNATLAGGACRI